MIRGWTGGIALTVTVLAWMLRHQVAVVTVVGSSMRPTLSHGDRVLVCRASLRRLRPGLVAVIEKPGPENTWTTSPPRWPGRDRTWMIKRVAALPGDPLPDLTHPSGAFPRAPAVPPAGRVPRGTFVALGDNPGGSYDSRVFGCCPGDRLLGVVVRRYGVRNPSVKMYEDKVLKQDHQKPERDRDRRDGQ